MAELIEFDLKKLMRLMQINALAFDKPISGYSPDEITILGRCFLESMHLYNWQQAVSAIGALYAATGTQKTDEVPF